MPKLKNVTAAELKAAIETAEDTSAIVATMAARIQQGYCDELPSLVQAARSFLSAGIALSELAHSLIVKSAMQEQRAELETLLRKDKSK